MRNVFTKSLSLFLSAILFVGLILPVTALAKGKAGSERMDLSLVAEEEMIDELIVDFGSVPTTRATNGDSLSQDIKNPQITGKNYVPSGAICRGICVYEGAVFVDYEINGVSYSVAYYPDGEIHKAAREVNGKIVYGVTNKDNRVEVINPDTIQETQQILNQEAQRRMDKMLKERWEESDYPIQPQLRASYKTVYSLKYNQTSDTKPYKGKQVKSGNVTIAAFKGTKHSQTQAYKVYETQSYHSEVKKKSTKFASGSALVSIAKTLAVLPTTLIGWLKAAGVVIKAAKTISEAC